MNTTLQSQLAPFLEDGRQHLSSSNANTPAETRHKISAAEQATLVEAAQAIKNWEASTEGQAKLQAMKGMSLPQVRQELIALLQSPVFAPTLELINKPQSLPSPIGSVSLGVKFEVEVILGFSGSIGVALSPHELLGIIQDPRSGSATVVTFLSLGLDAGVEAGAFTGVEFGIWGNDPDDLGGLSYGGEVTVVDDVGVSIQGFTGSSADSWGVTVTVGAGADDGAEGDACYTIILTDNDFGLPPVYQPDAAHFMIITSIVCQNSNMDTDNVYFNFTVDNGTTYRYPTWDHRGMSEDKGTTYHNTWDAGRSIKFNTQVEVTLYSETDVGDDDQLGNTITFSASKFVSPQYPDSKHGINETTYQVNATLIY